eukprot:363330-Chlamydomonas_euryale.AAC.1
MAPADSVPMPTSAVAGLPPCSVTERRAPLSASAKRLAPRLGIAPPALPPTTLPPEAAIARAFASDSTVRRPASDRRLELLRCSSEGEACGSSALMPPAPLALILAQPSVRRMLPARSSPVAARAAIAALSRSMLMCRLAEGSGPLGQADMPLPVMPSLPSARELLLWRRSRALAWPVCSIAVSTLPCMLAARSRPSVSCVCPMAPEPVGCSPATPPALLRAAAAAPAATTALLPRASCTSDVEPPDCSPLEGAWHGVGSNPLGAPGALAAKALVSSAVKSGSILEPATRDRSTLVSPARVLAVGRAVRLLLRGLLACELPPLLPSCSSGGGAGERCTEDVAASACGGGIGASRLWLREAGTALKLRTLQDSVARIHVCGWTTSPVQSGLGNCFQPLCLPFLSAPGGRLGGV